MAEGLARPTATMDLTIELDDHDHLAVSIADGNERKTVSAPNAPHAAALLLQAIEDAVKDGYGECFWPAPDGQYWWMFRRDHETLEVVAMWTRGGASGWQHVCRGTDSAEWIRSRVAAELTRLELPGTGH